MPDDPGDPSRRSRSRRRHLMTACCTCDSERLAQDSTKVANNSLTGPLLRLTFLTVAKDCACTAVHIAAASHPSARLDNVPGHGGEPGYGPFRTRPERGPLSSAASTASRLRCRGYPLRHVGRVPGPGQPGRRPDLCGQDSPLSRGRSPVTSGAAPEYARLTCSKMCVTVGTKVRRAGHLGGLRPNATIAL